MAVFDRVVAVVIEGGIPGVRMAVLMQHLAEKVEEQDFSLVPNAERDAREEAAALLLQQQLRRPRNRENCRELEEGSSSS
ncbi:hypothetical protein R1sor_007739 [Riccia sorocarpa]|uniref:Uncharacterized protein n=1 Tax=Riccia sorocarpa TaxID=122646 RepID=A0ABD3HRN4_9MARC